MRNDRWGPADQNPMREQTESRGVPFNQCDLELEEFVCLFVFKKETFMLAERELKLVIFIENYTMSFRTIGHLDYLVGGPLFERESDFKKH